MRDDPLSIPPDALGQGSPCSLRVLDDMRALTRCFADMLFD